MPGDHGEESDDERRQRESAEILNWANQVDPEAVEQELLNRGPLLEQALAKQIELADSEDPLVREAARQFLAEYQLGFLLAPETDEP